MRAKVVRSTGKHYGTRIEVEDGEVRTSFDVWIPEGRPSDEELYEMFRINAADWENNVEVCGTEPVQGVHPCDCHYESQVEFDLCRKIADAINGCGA